MYMAFLFIFCLIVQSTALFLENIYIIKYVYTHIVVRFGFVVRLVLTHCDGLLLSIDTILTHT